MFNIALLRAGFSLRLVSVRIGFALRLRWLALVYWIVYLVALVSAFFGGTTPQTPRVLRTPSVTLRKTRTSLCLRTSCAYRFAIALRILGFWEFGKSKSRRFCTNSMSFL